MRAYAAYLGATFWPRDLAFFYPHPAVVFPKRLALGHPGLLGSAALLVALSALAWFQRRRRPWLLVGWLWFLGVLVPVIGIVQVGLQGRADRYTYLPALGLSIAVAWTLREVGERRHRLAVGLALGATLGAGLGACEGAPLGLGRGVGEALGRGLGCSVG